MSRVVAIHQGKARPPARRDEFVPVLEVVRQRDLLGRLLITPEWMALPTHDDADWTRRGLYMAARYYCSCGQRNCHRAYDNVAGCPRGGQRLSCRADIVKDAKGRLRVQFTVYDKREAIRRHVATYGPDPSRWPYQAKARRLKEA